MLIPFYLKVSFSFFSWKHEMMNSKTYKNIKWDYKDASQRLLKLMYRSKINHFIFVCSSKTCWTRLILTKWWKLVFISEHMNFYQTKNNDSNYCLPSFENNRSSFFCLTRRFWNQIFTFEKFYIHKNIINFYSFQPNTC